MSRNIADESTVKKAEMKEKDLRRQQLNDIRTVLSNASGRRLLWRFLERCNTFKSIYSEHNTTMAYMSGQQDLGHFLMGEIVEADENLMVKLMKDNQRKGGLDV